MATKITCVGPDSSIIHSMNYGQRLKEIKTDKEKTFVGKAHVVLNIKQLGYVNPLLENTIKKTVLTEEEFKEYNAVVDQLIADPSYQSVIIDELIEGMENFWKYKKLGGTWIETKEEALKNVKAHVDQAFLSVIIDVDTYYNIEVLPDYFQETPRSSIGRIMGEHIKTCKSYPALLETATQFVVERIEADMKENIDNDNTKIENDLMMLKILLKKYPNVGAEYLITE